MAFWSSVSFLDANSPVMEQLMFFYDHAMIVLVFIIVLLIMIMISLSTGKGYNRFLLESHDIEVIWTLLPALMLIFIAIPSLRLLYLMEESFKNIISVKIMGHQWYWSYEYSDFNLEFDSFMIPEDMMSVTSYRLLEVDNNLVLPYLMNIRLLVSSFDVIHSWTIPSLGVKVDAVPGRLNQLLVYGSRAGLYFGQCSEICGANHSFMPIVVEFVSLSNFIVWCKNF